MSKRKLAIFICGLARSWDETYTKFYENIILPNESEFEIDLYIISWEKSYNRLFYQITDQIDFKLIDIEGIKLLYKPKLGIFRNYVKYNKTRSFKMLKDLLLSHNDLPKQGDLFVENAIISQFFIWDLAIQITKSYEYDVMLKSRFDLSFNKKICINNVLKNDNDIICNSDLNYFNHGFSDLFFFGNKSNMIRLMQVYRSLIEYTSSDNLYPEVIIKNIFGNSINLIGYDLDITLKRKLY